jgi:hypothetical protein
MRRDWAIVDRPLMQTYNALFDIVNAVGAGLMCVAIAKMTGFFAHHKNETPRPLSRPLF